MREMSMGVQLVIAVVLVGVLVGVGLYVWPVKPLTEANTQAAALLKQKQDDNRRLQQFERDLPGLERQIASLQQQLEIQKTIVPDEKAAPDFMHLMQDTAASAGIEIRRYTTKPVVNREFYTEVPYEMDIDGSYYGVVNFFEKVAKLQRIINVNGLQIATVKKPSDAKVKGTYTYAPGETVLASCTATTFFSHEPEEQGAPAPAKPGQPGAAPAVPAR